MRPIKNIIITGDIFRPSPDNKRPSTQNGNITWLYHLIRHAVELTVTSIPLSPLLFTGDLHCLATDLYRATGHKRTFETWVSNYENQPSPRELSIIDHYLGESFVIGFEINDFLIKGLDTLGIPYVDLTIHPARFLDDLIFGLRTNIPALGKTLTPWIVPEEEIRIHAGLAMATLSRLRPLPQCKNVHAAALFCCQTTDDKVLIQNGRLLRADDFIPHFETMCRKHEVVYVKPHPYAPTNPVTLAITRLFPNTEIITENFYQLLIQEGISHVYSITSSTSIEAAYFRKNGIHIGKYPYQFSETYGTTSYLTISSDIYTPQFWRGVFSATPVDLRDPPYQLNISKSRNRIRATLGNYWGADIFSRPAQ